MISDADIDAALLANITSNWRKIAFVVGTTMQQVEPEQRAGKDDLYFAKRVELLAKRGSIEHKGDLHQMRECEIRLAPDPPDSGAFADEKLYL